MAGTGRRRGLGRAAAAGQGARGLSAKAIAVFGSTGGVGLEAIYQALDKGFEVRALARTPANVVVPPGSGGEAKAGQALVSPALKITQGDVTSYDDVKKVRENAQTPEQERWEGGMGRGRGRGRCEEGDAGRGREPTQ